MSKWTRERAISWIQNHQYIDTVGDFENIIIDGDGRDLYEARPGRNVDLSSIELGKLLSFVFNDYVEATKLLKTRN